MSIELPKINNKSRYSLIPDQVFEIISHIDNADAIIVYLRFFIHREYCLDRVRKKRVSIPEAMSELGWSKDRVGLALEYLEGKGLISFADKDEPSFIMDFVVHPWFDERQEEDEIEDPLKRLKNRAVKLLLDNAPIKGFDCSGGFPGNMKCLNEHIKKCKRPEVYLQDLCLAIVHEARRGEPKSSIKWFSPVNVLRIVNGIKEKNRKGPDQKRGSVFSFEFTETVRKKVKNCYDSFQLDSEKCPEEEMIKKAVDFIARTAEKKNMNIPVKTIENEVNKAWKELLIKNT